MSEVILELENVRKYFRTGRGLVKAVDDVSFKVNGGEIFGLVGESGSGKTTIGNIIVGIYTPTSGKILYRGNDISNSASERPKWLKKDIQMVFQNPASSLNPRRTVKQILELPLRVHLSSANVRDKVDELLAMVDLPLEFADRYPDELGGGEKQLVAIARALSVEPSLIVLDEPTSALDVSVQGKIVNVLLRLKEKFNLSYIFITHNLSLMSNVANRVAIMYLGKLRELAQTRDFFLNPLHPYTQMLIASIPVVTEEEEQMKPKRIESRGEISGALKVPPGCSFHPRCPYVMNICKAKDPEFTAITEGHYCSCHLYVSEVNKS